METKVDPFLAWLDERIEYYNKSKRKNAEFIAATFEICSIKYKEMKEIK